MRARTVLFRSVLLVVALMVGLASLSAAVSAQESTEPWMEELIAAAKAEGQVVVFSPAKGAMMQTIAKAFSDKYGIQVTTIYAGSTQILNRVRAEKGNPTGDVWWGGGGMVPFLIAKREGLLQPYQIRSWDVPEKLGEFIIRDPEWYWTGPMAMGLGWTVHESVDISTLPPDLRGLTGPEWKDQIESSDPAASGTAVAFLISTVQRFLNEGKTEDEAFEVLKQYAANVRRFTESGSAPAAAVARGEVKIGLSYDQHYYLQAQRAEPVKWYLPPSTMISVDPMAMIAGAKHPNAAKLYMEFIYSKEAQQIISFAGPHVPVRSDVPLNPILEDTIESFSAAAMHLDTEWIVDNFDRLLQRWRMEIGY